MRRSTILLVLAGVAAALLLASCRTPALELVVTSSADAPDAAPGDGTCETATPGECTLRAAVQEANATGDYVGITLAPGATYGLTVAGAGEDAAATGDLDVTGDVLVRGQGATIDAASLDRVLHVHGGGALRVEQATLTGGDVAGDGGAVLVDGGSVELVQTTVGASTASGSGGALAVSSGSATVTRSTLTGGTAATGGGIASAGTLTVGASTISGNVATTAGGGLAVTGGAAAVHDTTVAADQAPTGGGIHATGGTTTLAGTIVASQVAGADCSGAVTSVGANLDSDGSCGLAGPADQTGVDPLLAPLGANGGPTATHLPQAGSPALDVAGHASCAELDQRGVVRPEGPTCDVGAVEVVGAGPHRFIVSTGTDATDAAPGDGICADALGECTLRAAVQEANASPGPDAIDGGPLVTLALVGTSEDAAATGDLDIVDDVTLTGVSVDASSLSDRIFDVHPGATLTVEGAVLTGGSTSGSGGALLVRSGATAAVERSTLADNLARGSADCIVSTTAPWVPEPTDPLCNAGDGGGGGAYVEGTLALTDSTLSGNVADASVSTCYTVMVTFSTTATWCRAGLGGGVSVGPGGDLDATNTTFSGNTADGGGAVGVVRLGQATLTNVTAAGNVATGAQSSSVIDDGGTIAAYGAAPDLRATVLTGDAPLCALYPGSGDWSSGFNVVGDDTCGTGDATDHPAHAVGLEPLATNGGRTWTHLPYADPAIVDAIPPGTSGLCDGTVATDQRGVARPAGAGCDAGAVEGDNGLPGAPLALVVTSAADAGDAVPGDRSCDVGDGSCTLRAAIDEANAWPYPDTITIAGGIDPVLALAGAGEDGNATGDLDVADDLTLHGGGATLDAADLDRALEVHADGSNPTVAVDDLTVTGGTADDGGDIAHRGGALDLVDVTIADGTATGSGGGLLVAGGAATLTGGSVEGNVATAGGGLAVTAGSLDLIEVTVTANTASHPTASARGGGARVDAGGQLTVTRSTFSANLATSTAAAPRGGGVANEGGSLTVTASTFADNVAQGTFFSSGGAISHAGTTHLRWTTITGGNAASGRALAGHGGYRANVSTTVISTGGKACSGSNLFSLDHNVVADTTCPFAQAADQVGVDPLLGPLADNGGATATQVPSAASPALDVLALGSTDCFFVGQQVDQRGVDRPVGSGCDVGAVERTATDP